MGWAVFLLLAKVVKLLSAVGNFAAEVIAKKTLVGEKLFLPINILSFPPFGKIDEFKFGAKK